MDLTHAMLNGSLIRAEEAVISAYNIEYTYGFGVYESIRVTNGIAYFLDNHIERLLESARIISLFHSVSHDDVRSWVHALMATITDESYNLKILLIGAPSPERVQCFILPLRPSFPDKRWYKRGVTVSVAQYERLFPQAKTLNMLGSYLAYNSAKKNGHYDALLTERNGHITEGTRTNVLFIRGNSIVTPPNESILPGITRDVVLHVAQKLHIPLLIEPIPLTRISEFGGAFLTSTSSKILPIRAVADQEFGELPPTLLSLMNEFSSYLASSKGIFRKEH